MKSYVFYSRFDGDKGRWDSKYNVFWAGAIEAKSLALMIRKMVSAFSSDKIKIKSVNLYTHSSENFGFYVGSDLINLKTMNRHLEMFRSLRRCFSSDAIFTLDGCALGHEEKLMEALAEAGGVKIRAYRDLQASNFLLPRGEGPSKICHPDGRGCIKESEDPWEDGDGYPIINLPHWYQRI